MVVPAKNFNSSTTISVGNNVSTMSFGGGEDNSVLNSSQLSNKIDTLLSQLKCERAFQDEESLNGQTATVFSSFGVSKLIALICGMEKNELKADMRQTLKDMEGFFKELIKDTNVSNGMKLKEALNELFHNPEHIVFQTLLTSEPADWAKLVLPILLDIEKMEVLKEELQMDTQDIQMKRRELSKDVGLEKKRLGELRTNRQDTMDKIHPDSLRRLNIALESDRAEIDKIEGIRAKCGTVVTNDEVEDLLSRFGELKSRRQYLKNDLAQTSADGVLPADINNSTMILKSRKTYLEALLDQIANPVDLDVSTRSMLDNSVFRRKSSN